MAAAGELPPPPAVPIPPLFLLRCGVLPAAFWTPRHCAPGAGIFLDVLPGLHLTLRQHAYRAAAAPLDSTCGTHLTPHLLDDYQRAATAPARLTIHNVTCGWYCSVRSGLRLCAARAPALPPAVSAWRALRLPAARPRLAILTGRRRRGLSCATRWRNGILVTRAPAAALHLARSLQRAWQHRRRTRRPYHLSCRLRARNLPLLCCTTGRTCALPASTR